MKPREIKYDPPPDPLFGFKPSFFFGVSRSTNDDLIDCLIHSSIHPREPRWKRILRRLRYWLRTLKGYLSAVLRGFRDSIRETRRVEKNLDRIKKLFDDKKKP